MKDVGLRRLVPHVQLSRFFIFLTEYNNLLEEYNNLVAKLVASSYGVVHGYAIGYRTSMCYSM